MLATCAGLQRGALVVRAYQNGDKEGSTATQTKPDAQPVRRPECFLSLWEAVARVSAYQ